MAVVGAGFRRAADGNRTQDFRIIDSFAQCYLTGYPAQPETLGYLIAVSEKFRDGVTAPGNNPSDRGGNVTDRANRRIVAQKT
ncbi:hypothetical protein [Mycolicibacterium sp. HK-90]|uniref:hypothetical protein n=1 Tax=Mycolicibacterium sp. HK-90 TaxID=3056937 RepID=UPI00265AC03D|nr:hypothetical protein [Mycolicibacterium sp. HK-90]WKG03655.1 hypothetical protein QU592_00430 [Mycolicibacterium sp. HK-90]